MPRILHRYGLPGLLLLFVVLRLLQACGVPYSYDDEEGYTAAAAFELLAGSPLPYQAFVLSDWELGTAASVGLAVPLIMLLGPSLLALKLTALCFSVVTLVALYALGRRVFGEAAGLAAGLLFVLFPGPLLHYSLVAHGFHPESTALQLLFLLQLMRVLDGRSDARNLLLCGVLAGLCAAFAYIGAIPVVCAGGLLLATRLERPHLPGAPGRVALLGAGLLLGLLPWLLYNLANGFAGLVVYGDRPLWSYLSPAGIAGKLAHFSEHTLPVFMAFHHWFGPTKGQPGAFAVLFWALALAALVGPLAARALRAGEPAGAFRLRALLGGVLLLTLFVFVASEHPVYPWHLYPLITLLLVPLGGATAALCRRGTLGRVLGLAVPLAVAFVGVPQNAAELRPGDLDAGRVLDGRNRPLFHDRLRALADRPELRFSFDNMQKWLRVPLEAAMAAPGRTPFHTSQFGQDLYLMMGGEQSLRRLGPWLADPARRDSGDTPWVLAGVVLAHLLGEGHPLPRVLGFVASQPAQRAPRIMEGLGFALPPEELPAVLDALAARGRIGDAWSSALALGRGRGIRAALLFDRATPYCGAALPEPVREHHMAGLGRGMACQMVTRDPAPLLRRVCARYRVIVERAFRRHAGECHEPWRLR